MAAKRVTSMLLVDDVAATVARFEQQGMQAFASDEPECVGLMAEATRTGLMVLGAGYAARSIPPGAVAELRKGAGLYIWVDSLDEIVPSGVLLGEVETDYGTRERYVREEGGLVAYAEQLGH
jgi:hypothetical protein